MGIQKYSKFFFSKLAGRSDYLMIQMNLAESQKKASKFSPMIQNLESSIEPITLAALNLEIELDFEAAQMKTQDDR